MRRRDDVRVTEQRMLRRRLGCEHIERGAGEMTVVELILQRFFVEQTAARAIDHIGAFLQPGEIFTAQDIAGLIGQRRVQRDNVGARQQRFKIGLFNSQFNRALFSEERVKRDDAHFKTDSTVGDDGTDIAAANDAEGFTKHFCAHERRFLPLAGMGRGARLRD